MGTTRSRCDQQTYQWSVVRDGTLVDVQTVEVPPELTKFVRNFCNGPNQPRILHHRQPVVIGGIQQFNHVFLLQNGEQHAVYTAEPSGRRLTLEQVQLRVAALVRGPRTPPEASIGRRNALFIIDPQNDFHHGGSLAVANANDDIGRIITLIEKCGEQIDNIVVSMDSHQSMHIANTHFWIEENGTTDQHPQPFRQIVYQGKDQKFRLVFGGADEGAVRPAREADVPWATTYLQDLQAYRGTTHSLWPDHCIVGTPGWCVVPELMVALTEWCTTYQRQIVWVFKGENCRTEMFSAVRAAVVLPEDPRTWVNDDLVHFLTAHERVFVCGQARTHCVNMTIRDVFEQLDGATPADRNVFLINDCTSDVTVNGVPVSNAGNELTEYMANRAINSNQASDIMMHQNVNVSSIEENADGPKRNETKKSGFVARFRGQPKVPRVN